MAAADLGLPGIGDRVYQNMVRRYRVCVDVTGHHIEPFLGPSQYSPRVISGNHGKPKSKWPDADRESDPGHPECESSELSLRHLTRSCIGLSILSVQMSAVLLSVKLWMEQPERAPPHAAALSPDISPRLALHNARATARALSLVAAAYNQFTKFLEHFVTHKKQGKKANLLVLDGHSTHVSDPDILQFAVDNNSIMISIPTHTSHYIQPLDRQTKRRLRCSSSNSFSKDLHSKKDINSLLQQLCPTPRILQKKTSSRCQKATILTSPEHIKKMKENKDINTAKPKKEKF
ncbi:hypothetical protein PR048_012560 [Dryococelus australis]|uniref:DDE-1 domain-containing protein n=1 Tax=Dryococelus australis TaxID=614101 RepID=A0ABQ9HPP9_9NEOP|nr:hypothetical protein PR048_012560 [Dryococelus australis]